MTTAPDLPVSAPEASTDVAALVPYPSDPLEQAGGRPSLTVIPSQPGDGETIELDEALGHAFPRLKRYAVRRLHDEHEAEEVVQEALLRAFQHRHLLRTEDDLMAWLTVVTGRLVIDRLRVRGRSTPVAEMPPTSRAARDTADVVVARDEARIALDALEAMPGRQASVLWAREVEGLSYEDIGDRFGMSEPSVRSLLHRARRTLRREYAVRGGTLPGIGLVALAPWLRGLRVAGRLRHVARKGAGAAAVAATGIAAATVVPFGGHGTPAQAAPMQHPSLRIKAVSAPVARHHDALATATVAQTRSSATTTTAAEPGAASAPTSVRIHGPALCGGHAAGHTLSAGCTTHHQPTVYVRLPVPVAGNSEVGVSNDSRLCHAVPTTVITECDSTTRPSKGSPS